MVRAEAGARGKDVVIPFGLALFAAFFTTLHSLLWKAPVSFTRYALLTVADGHLVSGQKARRDLGYSPRPLRETVRDTVRWLMDNPRQPQLRLRRGIRAPRPPSRLAHRRLPEVLQAILPGSQQGR